MSTQGQGDVAGQLERPHAVSILSMSKEALGASLNRAWDEIDRLRTLLSSSRGEQGWRTMDSAPKDGRKMLGLIGEDEVGTIWWHRDAYEGEWWMDEADSEPEPTHWMPLPSAPGSVPTSTGIIPMGRENDGDKHVTAYMCLVDFECEVGLASGGNVVYPSIDECREGRKCVGGCGIVEVEIRATRVVQEPSDDGDVVVTGAEIEAQSSPQPTAGGDAPSVDTLAYRVACIRQGQGDTPRFEGPTEFDIRAAREWVEYVLKAFTDWHPKDALSAERTRVIEECAKVAEAEAASARSRGALDISQEYTAPLRVAAALRSLAQQDTGGAK